MGLSVKRKDLQALTLEGLTQNNPVPLAVLHLDNLLYRKRFNNHFNNQENKTTKKNNRWQHSNTFNLILVFGYYKEEKYQENNFFKLVLCSRVVDCLLALSVKYLNKHPSTYTVSASRWTSLRWLTNNNKKKHPSAYHDILEGKILLRNRQTSADNWTPPHFPKNIR